MNVCSDGVACLRNDKLNDILMFLMGQPNIKFSSVIFLFIINLIPIKIKLNFNVMCLFMRNKLDLTEGREAGFLLWKRML